MDEDFISSCGDLKEKEDNLDLILLYKVFLEYILAENTYMYRCQSYIDKSFLYFYLYPFLQ